MSSTTIPLKIISLEGNGYHLLCQITFFRKKYWAVVDTGASRSVFDSALLQKFCKTESDAADIQANTIFSTSETVQGTVTEFKIGRLKLKDYRAIGIDLSTVSETYAMMGHPPISAIIGSDIMYTYAARIDYAKSSLRMFSPAE